MGSPASATFNVMSPLSEAKSVPVSSRDASFDLMLKESVRFGPRVIVRVRGPQSGTYALELAQTYDPASCAVDDILLWRSNF